MNSFMSASRDVGLYVTSGTLPARTVRRTKPSLSSVRSRTVSNRADIPSALRRRAPNRIGPLLLSSHRICSVQGRVSISSSPLIGQPDCNSSEADSLDKGTATTFDVLMKTFLRPTDVTSSGYSKVPTRHLQPTYL